MEILINILTAILLLSASVLCIYIIIVLIKFKTFLYVLQKEIVEISLNLKPVLENLNIVAEKLKYIVSKIEDQVEAVNTLFGAFKRITNVVGRVEEYIQEKLEEPVIRLGAMLGNVVNRIFSFFGNRS